MDDPQSGLSASPKPPGTPSIPLQLMGTNGVKSRESEAQNQPDLFLHCMEIQP